MEERILITIAMARIIADNNLITLMTANVGSFNHKTVSQVHF